MKASRRLMLGCAAALVGANAAHDVTADESVLRHEAIVDAPVADVWKAFTTAEGLKSWMAAHADIDLRVGGKMRTRYAPDGTLGDAQTIENTILSLEPERMISLKATKCPEGFPYATAIQQMWTVVRFEAMGAYRTRVTCTSMGFESDEESRKMREHFDKGNKWTLDKLREKFAIKDAEPKTAEVERFIRSLVGGEWALDERMPDGSSLRGRLTATEMTGGKFVITESWVGKDGPPGRAKHDVFGRDPMTGGMRVWEFGEGGALSGGEIRLIADNRMGYDWKVESQGKETRYYVEQALEDSDSLRFMLYELKAGDAPGQRPADREPVVNALWKRQRGATTQEPASAAAIKRIDAEVVLRASLKDVWDAWTTSEGIATFFAPASKVELRPGGAYEMYFGPDQPKGLQGSEGCTVLAFRPMEMLSFTWNAPPKFPEIRKERTVVVVQFADLGNDQIRVALTHTGFGQGKDWDEVHQYFSKAWPTVMARLKEAFAKG